MHILLFIFYFSIGCYAILKIPFFRASGIRPSMLLLLFGLRVGAGCLHNWVAWRFFPNHGDIWFFFRESLVTKQELFTDFHRFLANNSVWAYMPYNTIEIMHAIFDVFSFDNLYINTLFFSFLVFGGSIALFRLFRDVFQNQLLAACCALLIPSTLFWTACIHKEGLLFMLLGFFYFHFYRGIKNGWTAGRVLGCFFLFLSAVFFRANTVVTVLPALFLWIAAEKWPAHRVKIVFGSLLGVLIIVCILNPGGLLTVPLQYLCERQQEFLVLKGNSGVYLPALQPTPASFWKTLPFAALNGFFQPLPGSGGQFIYLAFSAEIILIWLIVLFSLTRWFISRRSAPRPTPPNGPHPSAGPFNPAQGSSLNPPPTSPAFALSCLLFAFTGMLLIGFTVPFVGTIVRYRSIYLPFLLAPCLYSLRQHPLSQRLNKGLTRLLLRP